MSVQFCQQIILEVGSQPSSRFSISAQPSSEPVLIPADMAGMARRHKRLPGEKRVTEGGDKGVAKKKRKRKSRLPKGLDPANPGPPPDPERWLPKWQRSDFKRKRTTSRRREKVCRAPSSQLVGSLKAFTGRGLQLQVLLAVPHDKTKDAEELLSQMTVK